MKRLPRVRRRYMGSQCALKYPFRHFGDYSTGSQPSLVAFPADDLTRVVLYNPVGVALAHNKSPKDTNAGLVPGGSLHFVGNMLTNASEQGTVFLIW